VGFGWFWSTRARMPRAGPRLCRFHRRSAVRRRRCMSGSRRPRSTAANDVPSDVSDRLKALERENRELRQTNEILRKPSAYFAQAEFDCR